MIEWVHVCPKHGTVLLSNCSCGAPGKPFGVPRKGTSVGKPYLQGSFLECATPRTDGTRCQVRLSELEADRIEFDAVFSALTRVRDLALGRQSDEPEESFLMLRHLARTCRVIYPSSPRSKKILHKKVAAEFGDYVDERDLRNPQLLWTSREDSVYSGQSPATLELLSTVSAAMALVHLTNDEFGSLLRPFAVRARAQGMRRSNEMRGPQPTPPMRSSPSELANLAEAA